MAKPKAAKKQASEPDPQNLLKLLDLLAEKNGLVVTEMDGQLILHQPHLRPGVRKSVAAEMVEVATSLGITPMIPGLIKDVVHGIKSSFNRDVHVDNVATLSKLAQQARLYGYDKTAAAIIEMAANEAAGVEE